MKAPLPPIYRDCQRLLQHTEAVVRRFSRYHKYTLGTDLRRQAMEVMRTVHRAVFEKARQTRHVQALVWQVDDYKLTLQLAVDLGAFQHGKAGAPAGPGFSAFETAAQLAAAIGKQCGGWQKKVQAAAQAAASAGGPHAQAGDGGNPAAAGPTPGAVRQGARRDRPASLSARAAFVPNPGPEVQP